MTTESPPAVVEPMPPERLTPEDFVFEPNAVCLFKVKDMISLITYPKNPSYTEISLTNGQKIIARKPISRIEPRLPRGFFRARRGCIINLSQVRDITSWNRRNAMLTLTDTTEILVSRKQLVVLARHLGL